MPVISRTIAGNEKISGTTEQPDDKTDLVHNLNACIEFLKSHGVNTDNIDAEELAEGNLKSTLSLIGSIRQKYDVHYQQNSVTATNKRSAYPKDGDQIMPGKVTATVSRYQNNTNHIDNFGTQQNRIESEILPGTLGKDDSQGRKTPAPIISTTELGMNGVSQHGVEERRNHLPNSGNTDYNGRPHTTQPYRTAYDRPPSAASNAWINSASSKQGAQLKTSNSIEDRIKSLIGSQDKKTAPTYDDGEMLVPPPRQQTHVQPPGYNGQYTPSSREGSYKVNGSAEYSGYVPSRPSDRLPGTRMNAVLESNNIPSTENNQHNKWSNQGPMLGQMSGSQQNIYPYANSKLQNGDVSSVPKAANGPDRNDLRSAWNKLYGQQDTRRMNVYTPQPISTSQTNSRPSSTPAMLDEPSLSTEQLKHNTSFSPPHPQGKSDSSPSYSVTNNSFLSTFKDHPSTDPAIHQNHLSYNQSSDMHTERQNHFLGHSSQDLINTRYEDTQKDKYNNTQADYTTHGLNQAQTERVPNYISGQSVNSNNHKVVQQTNLATRSDASGYQIPMPQTAYRNYNHVTFKDQSHVSNAKDPPTALVSPTTSSSHTSANPQLSPTAIGPSAMYPGMPSKPRSRPSSANKEGSHSGSDSKNISDSAKKNGNLPPNYYGGNVHKEGRTKSGSSDDNADRFSTNKTDNRIVFGNKSLPFMHNMSGAIQSAGKMAHVNEGFLSGEDETDHSHLDVQDSIFDYTVSVSDSSSRSVTPPLPPLSPSQISLRSRSVSPTRRSRLSHSHSTELLHMQMQRTPDLLTNMSKPGNSERNRGSSSHSHGRKSSKKHSPSEKSSHRTKSSLKAAHSLHSSEIEAEFGDFDDGSCLSFDVENTILTLDSQDNEPITGRTSRINFQNPETQKLKNQLNGLEEMYHELLKAVDESKHNTAFSRPHRRWSIASSDTSSIRPVKKVPNRRGESQHKKHHQDREMKSFNKRFQRLESHVVTLARSVAHLSSEMRNNGTIVNEIEKVKLDIREIQDYQAGGILKRTSSNPDIMSELSRCRSWVPSLTNPKRVNKLTKFFGQEPPLLDLFLKKLGYEKFTSNFEAEHIGMIELPYMNEERLQKIGIPMGPRLRILQEAQNCFRKENYSVYMV